MDQTKSKNSQQVFYQGRWVSKQNFRVFVYNSSAQKLVNSYEEYEKLIHDGSWYSSKEELLKKIPPIKARKAKDGSTDS